MKIGRFNYKIVLKIDKKPDLKQMRKDLQGLLENFNTAPYSFRIDENKGYFICEGLEPRVYYNSLDAKFYYYLQKIGENYGFKSFGFPHYYYHK